jgi:hypothetical protein
MFYQLVGIDKNIFISVLRVHFSGKCYASLKAGLSEEKLSLRGRSQITFANFANY